MHRAHQKSQLAILEFSMHLIRKGFTVLTPTNPPTVYDLVTEHDGKFSRIQVKYLTARHGILRVEVDKAVRQSNRSKEHAVDAIGVYEAEQQQFYLIPVDRITSRSEIWMRTTAPKNAQKKHVHSANEFVI